MSDKENRHNVESFIDDKIYSKINHLQRLGYRANTITVDYTWTKKFANDNYAVNNFNNGRGLLFGCKVNYEDFGYDLLRVDITIT